jgi:hypothetical protein
MTDDHFASGDHRSPADPDSLPAEIVADLREVYLQSPNPSTEDRHLAAMMAAVESSPAGSDRRRLWAGALAATVVAVVALGGLASAGALPAPVQDAVSSVVAVVGIDVPRADGSQGEPSQPTPTTRGQSDDAPGHGGTTPGRSEDAPGQDGTAPGQSEDAPGQGGTAPGRSEEAPGLDGTPPGPPDTTPGRPVTPPPPNPGPPEVTPGPPEVTPGPPTNPPVPPTSPPGPPAEPPGPPSEPPGKPNESAGASLLLTSLGEARP